MSKPTPEIIFKEALDDEKQKIALEFIAWLRENKTSPSWQVTNKWRCNYKGKLICHIFMRGLGKGAGHGLDIGSYRIIVPVRDDLIGRVNDVSFDEWIKELAWNGRSVCTDCCNKCTPRGHTLIVYGKEFKGMCNTHGRAIFDNPDAEMIE
ncbi:MAG: hypothetical protein FWE06_00895 [Oscillospiraceae bacterium]|nr:hypothetical protein [Oscillospiraceae bacterium]